MNDFKQMLSKIDFFNLKNFRNWILPVYLESTWLFLCCKIISQDSCLLPHFLIIEQREGCDRCQSLLKWRVRGSLTVHLVPWGFILGSQVGGWDKGQQLREVDFGEAYEQNISPASEAPMVRYKLPYLVGS